MKKLLFTVALISFVFLANAQKTTIQDSKSTITSTETTTSAAVKKSLLEVFNGTWGGWNVDGDYVMDTLMSNNPNIIGVTFHNSDSMSSLIGDTVAQTYISAYPTAMIDRYNFPTSTSLPENRADWAARCTQRNATTATVGVSISSQTYNSSTRELSVTVRADFVANLTGDLRFNLYIVEDSVSGTGVGYDQANYYHTISGHPFFNAGTTITGYQHRKVLRTMLGGPWGSTGVIPASVSNGDDYSHTYTYTLPAGYDMNKIYLIGLVQNYTTNSDNRSILNSEEVRLDLLSSISKIETTFNLKGVQSGYV